jgi:hypothetical protein
MLVSVIRSYKWRPDYVLDHLFVDKHDIFGLVFWYEDVKKQTDEIKNSTTKSN